MLKSETIRANDTLKELSDDQISAIETLSENDENTVIAKKVGEIHTQYDTDIEQATGMKKPAGVKTYDFLKSDVLPVVKTANDDKTKAAGDLKVSTDKVLELEKAISENSGDAALKQQLKDAQDKTTKAQELYDTDKKSWEDKFTKAQGETLNFQIGSEFDKGLSGLKFKDEKIVSKNLRDITIKTAKSAVMTKYKSDFVDAEGARQLVFRDENGEILRNKENALHPFTATELMMKEPAMADIIDGGKKLGGAGSSEEGGSGGGSSASVDLSSAKTQIEADEIIEKQLLSDGLVKGTESFIDKASEIRKEADVSKLQMR